MRYDIDYARNVLIGDCRALLYALENNLDITAQMRRVEETMDYIKKAKEENEND